jgi:hypothetical protein
MLNHFADAKTLQKLSPSQKTTLLFSCTIHFQKLRRVLPKNGCMHQEEEMPTLEKPSFIRILFKNSFQPIVHESRSARQSRDVDHTRRMKLFQAYK